MRSEGCGVCAQCGVRSAWRSTECGAVRSARAMGRSCQARGSWRGGVSRSPHRTRNLRTSCTLHLARRFAPRTEHSHSALSTPHSLGQINPRHAHRPTAFQAFAHHIEARAVHEVRTSVALAEFACAHMRGAIGNLFWEERVESGAQVTGADLTTVEQHDHGDIGRACRDARWKAGGSVDQRGVHLRSDQPLNRNRQQPDQTDDAGGGCEPLEESRDAKVALLHQVSVTVLI